MISKLFCSLVLALLISPMCYSESLEGLHSLAEKGRIDAMYRLGYLYSGEESVDANIALSDKYYRMASERGDENAKYALAMNLLKDNRPEHHGEGLQILTSLEPTMPELTMYLAGRLARLPDTSSKRAALSRYEHIASLGDIIAQYNAGLLLLEIPVNDEDIQSALAYLRLAANSGHPKALVKLGELYRDGVVVEYDPVQALQYFMEAAVLGDGVGQYSVGYAYFTGEGVAWNLEVSYKWTALAAVQGVREAESLLGILCKDHPLYCVDRSFQQ